MKKGLEKYLSKPASNTNVPCNLIVMDDDFQKSYTKEELDRFSGKVNVFGFAEKKIGKWDDEKKNELPEPEPKIVKKHVDSDSDDLSPANDEAENKWQEYITRFEKKSEEIDESWKKNQILDGDPILEMKHIRIKKKASEANRGPQNRFGIKPGKWWDGIDRSNGYESRRFLKMKDFSNSKKENHLKSLSTL